MTLVSANLRLVPIFEGVHWRGGVKRQWGNRKHGFSRLSTLRLSTLRNETNVITYYYSFPCRLSTDPEIYGLGWLWMAWIFIIRYSIAICDLAFSNFLLTYLL